MPPLIPHHLYRAEAPTSPWELMRAVPCRVDAGDLAPRMLACGDAMRAAGVGAIVLVHGTFVGDDPLGVLGEVGRVAPGAESRLRRWSKWLTDLVMRENGNYTAGFGERMANSISCAGAAPIPVHRFHWSGENHHLARCEAALALIETLSRLDLAAGARILIWGHSHGGNVCALVSWLLAANPDELSQLLDAARVQYRSPLFKRVDRPLWVRVGERLRQRPGPLAGHALDVVTFGMPLRHRWTQSGDSRVLHFVHHRPVAGLPEWRACIPWNPFRVAAAADGDYVQHLGIAGTNFPPPWPVWRALQADWRLNRLLQGDVGVRTLWSRLKQGQRVADDGQALLVDYGPQGVNFIGHLIGHGVYTRSQWMLWHLEEIVRRWYAAHSAEPAAVETMFAGGR